MAENLLKMTPNSSIVFQPGDIKSPAASRKTSDEKSPSTDDASCEDGRKLAGTLFHNKTKAIIWGLQTRAVQVSIFYRVYHLNLACFIARCLEGDETWSQDFSSELKATVNST